MIYEVDCPKHGKVTIEVEKEVELNGMMVPCPFCHVRCEWYKNLMIECRRRSVE